MKREKIKPEKTDKGFKVPAHPIAALKKAAHDTGGTVNARLEAKLDYIIAKLEEGDE